MKSWRQILKFWTKEWEGPNFSSFARAPTTPPLLAGTLAAAPLPSPPPPSPAAGHLPPLPHCRSAPPRRPPHRRPLPRVDRASPPATLPPSRPPPAGLLHGTARAQLLLAVFLLPDVGLPVGQVASAAFFPISRSALRRRRRE